MLLEGVVDTLYMTLVSTFFSYVFGMMMGTVLVICRQDGITPRPMIYAVLDVVVNLTRSFPFLILMIAVIPLTRLLVGPGFWVSFHAVGRHRKKLLRRCWNGNSAILPM